MKVALLPEKILGETLAPLNIYIENLRDIVLCLLSLFDLNQYELYPFRRLF